MFASGRPAAGTHECPHRIVLVSSCGSWDRDTFDPLLAQMNAWCRHDSAILAEALLRSGIPVFSRQHRRHEDRIFAGALLRPHGPALREMMEKGLPVTEITDAAREAGYQLVRVGVISRELLTTVSQPLLPRDRYMQILNQRLAEIPNANPQGVNS